MSQYCDHFDPLFNDSDDHFIGFKEVSGGGGSGGDGGYYRPNVSSDGTLSWTPSSSAMPPVAPQNIKGPTGIAGPQGPKGDTGPVGPQGEAGAGFVIKGYYFDIAALESAVPSPETGAAYGVGASDPFDIYVWDADHRVWVNNGPLQGPKGATGPQGETGPQGPKGDTGATGAKGDTGNPATILSRSITYQIGSSGTIVPSGDWQSTIPEVQQGKYLWTRATLQFNTGDPVTWYSVAYAGINGIGSVYTVAGISPDEAGNVSLTAENVGARPNTWTPSAAEVGAIPDATGSVNRSNLASDAKVLSFTNKTVDPSAWVGDTTYTDFPYRAAVACSGVTANHYVEVIFSPADAMSGTFCPVTVSYSGGVYIYASEIPSATVTIPTIVCTPVA